MNDQSPYPISTGARIGLVVVASLAAGAACASTLVVVGFLASFYAGYVTGNGTCIWVGCWGAMGLSPFAFIIGAAGTAVRWTRRKCWSVRDAVKFISICLALALLPPFIVGWFV